MQARTESATPPQKKTSVVRRLLPLIGVAVLVAVISRLDRAALAAAVAKVDVAALLLAAGSFTVNLAFKGLRWWRILSAQNKALPLRVAMAAFFGAQFYGQVTVGRVGEFFRAEALMERGETSGSALSSCIVDRLFDLLTVFSLGTVLGAVVIGNQQVAWVAAGLLATGLSGFVAVYVAFQFDLFPEWMRALGRRLDQRSQGTGILAKVLRLVRDLVFDSLLVLRLGPMLEAACWTAVAWTFYFGALWMIAAGMGLPAPKAVLSACASLAALSALLPITVSGLGARELIYQQVLSSYDVHAATAVVVALLHLAVMSVSAVVFGLVGLGFRRRQRVDSPGASGM